MKLAIMKMSGPNCGQGVHGYIFEAPTFVANDWNQAPEARAVALLEPSIDVSGRT
jgi:hypothetical protein